MKFPIGAIVIQFPHDEAGSGWAFGLHLVTSAEGESKPGWFPEEYLDVSPSRQHTWNPLRVVQHFDGSSFAEDALVVERGCLVESPSVLTLDGWVRVRVCRTDRDGWLPAAFLEEPPAEALENRDHGYDSSSSEGSEPDSPV